MKVGRNDPCPCGSGKKYKKCCLDKLSSKSNVLVNHNLSKDLRLDYGVPILEDNFFRLNKFNDISAQRLIYSSLVMPEVEKFAYQTASRLKGLSTSKSAAIDQAKDAAELIKLANQKLDLIDHVPFMEKALQYRDKFIQLLFDELKISREDAFVELAIRFIKRTKFDYSNEIINLIEKDLSNAYYISIFCVLLGFYPNDKVEKLLWDYFHIFKDNYPNESYQDGPFLGLLELREQKKKIKLFNTKT